MKGWCKLEDKDYRAKRACYCRIQARLGRKEYCRLSVLNVLKNPTKGGFGGHYG
jgi:hypothetical protein